MSKGNSKTITRPLKRKRRLRSRFGHEAVELAIILPVMLLMTAGTLEICEGYSVQRKIEVAAHEGARVAIRRGATQQEVEDAVGHYLDARGIRYGEISSVVSSSPDPDVAGMLTPLTVTVEVDSSPNMKLKMLGDSLFVGSKISAEVTMFKEYAN